MGACVAGLCDGSVSKGPFLLRNATTQQSEKQQRETTQDSLVPALPGEGKTDPREREQNEKDRHACNTANPSGTVLGFQNDLLVAQWSFIKEGCWTGRKGEGIS